MASSAVIGGTVGLGSYVGDESIELGDTSTLGVELEYGGEGVMTTTDG